MTTDKPNSIIDDLRKAMNDIANTPGGAPANSLMAITRAIEEIKRLTMLAEPKTTAQLAYALTALRTSVIKHIATDGPYFDAVDEADELVTDTLRAEQERRTDPENR